MNEGYIKTYRQILDWEWWHDINTFRVFMYLLLKANWKEGKFKGVTVPIGSLVTSIPRIAVDTDLTENEVRTALKHLEITNEINRQTTSKFSLISLNNYELYQSESQTNHSQLTDKSQSINSQLTAIEEIKNIRKKEYILSNTNVLDCPSESQRNDSYSWLIDAWNTLTNFGIAPVKRITEGSKRISNVRARIKQYGKESMLEAIENIKHSDFLQGKHKGGSWQITFDWFILPSNFPKVLEGNYNNDGDGRTEKQNNKYSDYAKDLYSKLGIDV